MTDEYRYDCEDRKDGYIHIIDKKLDKYMNVGLVVYNLNKTDKLLSSLKKAFKTGTIQLDVNPMDLNINDYKIINEWLKETDND